MADTTANTEPVLDDNRRRLGLASLQGKIRNCISLLNYAEKVATEGIKSYDDPNKTDQHLYTCVEGAFASLTEVDEMSKVAQQLCKQIIKNKDLPPLTGFAQAMTVENS